MVEVPAAYHSLRRLLLRKSADCFRKVHGERKDRRQQLRL